MFRKITLRLFIVQKDRILNNNYIIKIIIFFNGTILIILVL
jgi:hypothetical protein